MTVTMLLSKGHNTELSAKAKDGSGDFYTVGALIFVGSDKS